MVTTNAFIFCFSSFDIIQHSLFLIPSDLCLYNYNYLAAISPADIRIIEG